MGLGNKYPQDGAAEIDLHGHTIDTALAAVKDFLVDSEKKNLGTVRIITGKGLHSKDSNNTIKDNVKKWLFARSYNFRYAKQNQGGEGVLIVVLS